jgi:hypothetical protein
VTFMFSFLSTISHPIWSSSFVRGRPPILASLMVASGLSFYSATTRITRVNPDDEASWTALVSHLSWILPMGRERHRVEDAIRRFASLGVCHAWPPEGYALPCHER